MDETLKELGETIASALGGAISAYRVAFGQLTLDARAEDIVKVMTFLRDDPRCQFMSFIEDDRMWSRKYRGVFGLHSDREVHEVKVVIDNHQVAFL